MEKNVLMTLSQLRKNKNLTTTVVAKRLNISQGQYSHIENGTRSINDETAKKLAGLFGTDVDEVRQISRDLIELRGTLRHWLSNVRYRGESLVDIIVNELRYDRLLNLEESEQLIYMIAGLAAEKIRDEIIWNFKDNPEFVNYFIKRLKE
jgi:transcriptional regulator with XRE-family HTH domain